jgi:hypothetical protein
MAARRADEGRRAYVVFGDINEAAGKELETRLEG